MVNVLMFGVSSSLVCVLALAGKVAEHPLGGRSRPSRNPSCLGRQRSVWTKWARRGAQRSRAAVRVALLPYFSFFRGEGDLGVAGRPGIRIAERGTMHIWSMKIFALEVFWLCKLTWVGTPCGASQDLLFDGFHAIFYCWRTCSFTSPRHTRREREDKP